MSLAVTAVAAVLGVWAAVAPSLLSWEAGAAVYASNVLPGAFAAALGSACCGLGLARRLPREVAQDMLLQTTSALAVLGAWMMVAPFVLGFPMIGRTVWACILPGAAILGLSLANGHLGWRSW